MQKNKFPDGLTIPYNSTSIRTRLLGIINDFKVELNDRNRQRKANDIALKIKANKNHGYTILRLINELDKIKKG